MVRKTRTRKGSRNRRIKNTYRKRRALKSRKSRRSIRKNGMRSMRVSKRGKKRVMNALKRLKEISNSREKKQLTKIARIYKLNGGMPYHHRNVMKGGNMVDDFKDFGSDMWTKFTNQVSDLRDVPEMHLGKLGNGVNFAAEHAAKHGLSGPAGGIRSIVDAVSGNNIHRTPLSIFDHPSMHTRNLNISH